MLNCFTCQQPLKNIKNKFCNRSCAAITNNKLTPKRGKLVRHCILCNTQLDTNRKYCADCYVSINCFKLTCPQCNLDFTSKIKTQKYCTKICTKKATKNSKYLNLSGISRKIRNSNKCQCGKVLNQYVKSCKDCIIAKSSLDTIKDVTYKHLHKSSAFNIIRSRARNIQKKLGFTNCKICGYSKIVETCHIKAISSFGEETLVSIVNHPDNLLSLCPNHHWELDHNLLDTPLI